MMNWIISFNPLKYSSHECVSWEDDLNNICDPKMTEFLFFSFSSARQHEYINPSITLSRSAVRSPGHACVRVTRSRWGKISVWLTWKKQNKTCVCIRALVCSPVGKISIDFFFFCFRPAGVVRSFRRINNFSTLRRSYSSLPAREWVTLFVWLAAYVCVRVLVLQGAHPQVRLFFRLLPKLAGEKCFMTLWSINAINQTVERVCSLLVSVCVCVFVSKFLGRRLKIETKNWTEDWICASNCEHKSSGGKKKSSFVRLSQTNNKSLNQILTCYNPCCTLQSRVWYGIIWYHISYHGLGEYLILIGCRVSINPWYMDTY